MQKSVSEAEIMEYLGREWGTSQSGVGQTPYTRGSTISEKVAG